MQGFGISLPVKIDQGPLNSGGDILWNNGQYAIIHGGFLLVAAEKLIAERELLHDEVIAWIQLD